jgi:hypothetical protein
MRRRASDIAPSWSLATGRACRLACRAQYEGAADLRSRLEKAAKKSGRSLTSEVGYRVERGFDYEKLFGSEYTQILIRLIADAITLIERNTGKRWNEDPMCSTVTPFTLD